MVCGPGGEGLELLSRQAFSPGKHSLPAAEGNRLADPGIAAKKAMLEPVLRCCLWGLVVG